MAKIADEYFKLDPWKIIEEGFDPAYNEVAESVFSLGNEYMGVRGYFEEGTTAPSLQGSYFNGIYERDHAETGLNYKGIVSKTHFMVNAVDSFYTKLELDGEMLDMNQIQMENFKRELNLKTGELSRTLTWITHSGKRLKITFERFLHMENYTEAFQKITFEPENFSGAIKVTVGQNFGTTHGSNDAKYWNTTEKGFTEKGAYIVSDTTSSNQRVFSGFELEVSREIVCERLETEKFVGYTFDFPLEKAQQDSLTKYITNLAEKNISLAEAEFVQKGHSNLSKQHECGYEAAKASQQAFWENVWAKFDIKIDGDLKNQQGIRYCIFQLQQTYHGQDPTNNIGAKGLTGEAYNGHAFWDTETCCLPYYLFTNLKAAKNLLEFRYSTLAEAKNRARQLDCEGACYPIATLNGEEACTLWQHASTQFQPSTGVAYGIWHYVHLSEDNEFLYNHGAEMLTEIARFLRSRGDYSAATGKFGFYGVMGPDEFQVMVNHNSYTNYMAKMTFLYTIQVLKEMKSTAPEQYAALQAKTNVTEVEINEWKNAADQTLLLQEANGLFEQHDGYFDLPHINVDQIPVEDFPLYSHWSYDRIYRNDMIKQPDVLMFQFLYNQQFSKAEKRVNYEYYEPRTIHESSLSPSVHSVLASELGKHEEAFDFFGFATRMDLDNYNRNTREGLHTTSIAAAWVNIVYGFGGLRSDGPVLILNPTIPKKWNSYTFRVDYKQAIIEVHVEKTEAIFRVLNAETAAVMIYGKEETLDSTAKCIAIPAEWQN